MADAVLLTARAEQDWLLTQVLWNLTLIYGDDVDYVDDVDVVCLHSMFQFAERCSKIGPGLIKVFRTSFWMPTNRFKGLMINVSHVQVQT